MSEFSCLHTQNLQLKFPLQLQEQKLNFNFQAGQSWGILGPNGSGKSTLLLTLAGLLNPASGQVFLQGKELTNLKPKRRAQLLGLQLQQLNLNFNPQVLELVMQGRFAHTSSWRGFSTADEQLAMQALQQVGLAKLAQRGINSLSGGEKQRVALAMLLCQNPKILCLDEPSNHLDLNQQIKNLQLLQQAASQGKLVLMALHDVNLAARFCSHYIFLHADGRVQQGSKQEILRLEFLEDLYQQPLQAVQTNNGEYFLPC